MKKKANKNEINQNSYVSLAPDRKMFNRVLIILCIVLGGILPYLLYHLTDVQIIRHEEYQSRAISQQVRSVTLLPVRGTIYDANMNEVAVSTVVEHVCFAPANMSKVTQEAKEALCRYMSELLELDYDTLLVKIGKTESYYQVAARNVDKSLTDQLRDYIDKHGITGVDFYPSSERYYPYGDFAPYVIGHTNADGEGIYGVESTYDSILSGQAGRIITARNRDGEAMPFSYEQYLDSEDGLGVVLTVDHDVQDILMKYLEKATKDNDAAGATGLVMRIRDAAIVASGSYPSYDLNDPRTLSDEIKAEIETLPENQQGTAANNAMFEIWRNRVISEAYEPGSTFKIVTAAMALEESLVRPSEGFYCAGSTHVAGWDIRCWKHGGHGALDFTHGVMGSCNCVFMEVGKRVGCNRFYNYVNLFGLTAKTGIDLPGESSGVFFDEDSFDDNEANIAVASFGQRFKITPMQLLTTVSGIANGGNMMKPHVVSAYTDADGNIVETVEPEVTRQIVSKETSETICKILEKVVSEGTGRNAYAAGYRVGGKTGTSEKFDEEENYIASFLGIAPCDDPEYAVLLYIDEPQGQLYQGGQIAAPVVGALFGEILPILGVEAVYTDSELATLQAVVPKLNRMTVKEATEKAQKVKLSVEVVGDGEFVTAQIPAYGSKISSKTPILLYCGEAPAKEMGTVPSVVGLSYAAAVARMDQAGFYMTAIGAVQTSIGSSVRAKSQSVAPGTELEKGSVISVEFLDANTYNTGE